MSPEAGPIRRKDGTVNPHDPKTSRPCMPTLCIIGFLYAHVKWSSRTLVHNVGDPLHLRVSDLSDSSGPDVTEILRGVLRILAACYLQG